MLAASSGKRKMERKLIRVSIKRQITIPQKYFDTLGFESEAECILQKDGILIRPVRNNDSGEFSEQILTDLIARGFEGDELLRRFKEAGREIRPAVKKMIEEADALAGGTGEPADLEQLFEAEE